MIVFTNPILIIVALANLLLGALILWRDRKNIISSSYAFLSFSVSIWALSIYFFRILEDIQPLLIWAQIAYISAALSALLCLLFLSYLAI
jgi:hypothetical protein